MRAKLNLVVTYAREASLISADALVPLSIVASAETVEVRFPSIDRFTVPMEVPPFPSLTV